MPDFLALLPFILGIIVAQAIGVSLAWGVDAVSWKWRQNGKSDEKRVFDWSVIGLASLLPLSAPLYYEFLSPLIASAASVFLLFWLFVVAWVQKQQLKISLRAAVFGAVFQLVCLSFALGGCFLLMICFWLYVNDSLALIWLTTTVLTYALLSLFRPTIYGTWNAWRQNSRKN